MSNDAKRLKSVLMLILTTAFWGVSFPTTKALALAQQTLLPGSNSWFLASLCVVYRFAAATLILLIFSARRLRQMTRLEFEQGLGLGLFGGGGLLLQVDGMAYTAASTSAFLTQGYCLLIPLWVAWRERRPPAAKVLVSCGMVMAGVAVLAKVDWHNLNLGRGEWETMVASVLFTGQILWLERPEYAGNNTGHFSLVMFAVMVLVGLPVAALSSERPADWLRAYHSVATTGLLFILVFCCTLGGYLVMNHWQRYVTATEAGLIYCLEPVWASLLALALPAWFSAWTGVGYANEQLTGDLLIGGGLITAANVWIQFPCRPAGDAAAKIDSRTQAQRNSRIVGKLDDTPST